jgi:hypothetical protein
LYQGRVSKDCYGYGFWRPAPGAPVERSVTASDIVGNRLRNVSQAQENVKILSGRDFMRVPRVFCANLFLPLVCSQSRRMRFKTRRS